MTAAVAAVWRRHQEHVDAELREIHSQIQVVRSASGRSLFSMGGESGGSRSSSLRSLGSLGNLGSLGELPSPELVRRSTNYRRSQ